MPGVRLRIIVGALALAVSLPAGASDSAVSTVVRLYEEFAWEAVIVEPRLPGLIDQPRAVLQKYFEKPLTDLILRDRECARTTHEVCALDFMPLWDAQEAGATDLSIHATPDPSVVEVGFRYPGEKGSKKLTYQLVRAEGKWRVRDIRGHDWSLRSLLERNR
jgi:hypothetical protein